MQASSTLAPLGASERIVDRVHASIRSAILAGDIAQGAALSVPDLSRRLNVSRSPVREAVLQLVADGLAVETPRRGVVVKAVDAVDLLEIHEIREFLEALAARKAAVTGDALVSAALICVLERQAVAIAGDDGLGFFETDRAFHEIIAEASGSGRLIRMQRHLRLEMSLALRSVAANARHARHALEEHTAIAAAIQQRNANDAEMTMRKHIDNTRRRMLE